MFSWFFAANLSIVNTSKLQSEWYLLRKCLGNVNIAHKKPKVEQVNWVPPTQFFIQVLYLTCFFCKMLFTVFFFSNINYLPFFPLFVCGIFEKKNAWEEDCKSEHLLLTAMVTHIAIINGKIPKQFHKWMKETWVQAQLHKISTHATGTSSNSSAEVILIHSHVYEWLPKEIQIVKRLNCQSETLSFRSLSQVPPSTAKTHLGTKHILSSCFSNLTYSV